MHFYISLQEIALIGILLASSSPTIAAPTRAGLLSSLGRIVQLFTHRSTLQIPYPDHYGPKSCRDVTKSQGNLWRNNSSPVKLDSLSIPSISSLPTAIGNTSNPSLASRAPKPDHSCYLISSYRFEVSDVASAMTPQGRLRPYLEYVFSYDSNTIVYQIQAWWRESPQKQVAIADIYPNAVSGTMWLTVSDIPRDIQFELVFVTSGTHEGRAGLFQILLQD